MIHSGEIISQYLDDNGIKCYHCYQPKSINNYHDNYYNPKNIPFSWIYGGFFIVIMVDADIQTFILKDRRLDDEALEAEDFEYDKELGAWRVYDTFIGWEPYYCFTFLGWYQQAKKHELSLNDPAALESLLTIIKSRGKDCVKT